MASDRMSCRPAETPTPPSSRHTSFVSVRNPVPSTIGTETTTTILGPEGAGPPRDRQAWPAARLFPCTPAPNQRALQHQLPRNRARLALPGGGRCERRRIIAPLRTRGRGSVENRLGHGAFGWRRDARERFAANGAPHIQDARREPREESTLRWMSGNEQRRVNRTSLSDAIDSSDSLLDPRRCPGELEADDPSRTVLQVQSLTGDIGREKHRHAAGAELADGGGALSG